MEVPHAILKYNQDHHNHEYMFKNKKKIQPGLHRVRAAKVPVQTALLSDGQEVGHDTEVTMPQTLSGVRGDRLWAVGGEVSPARLMWQRWMWSEQEIETIRVGTRFIIVAQIHMSCLGPEVNFTIMRMTIIGDGCSSAVVFFLSFLFFFKTQQRN